VPRIDKQTRYGKIIIARYGFDSRFTIFRSDTNAAYFWIAVPKANDMGKHLPLYALGDEFVDLVNSTADAPPSAR
jgi:hypothetical protein